MDLEKRIAELELKNRALKNEIHRLKCRAKVLSEELNIMLSENMLPEYKYIYYFDNGLVITKGGGKLAQVIKDIKEYLNE